MESRDDNPYASPQSQPAENRRSRRGSFFRQAWDLTLLVLAAIGILILLVFILGVGWEILFGPSVH